MGRKSKKFLTLREVKALFQRVTFVRDRALFLLAYRHGLRVSEVCGMLIEDVQLEENRVFCRRLKGSVSGYHIVDAMEKKLLERYISLPRARSKWLFPGMRTGHVSRQTVDRMIKSYGERARIPKGKRHFHILKHSIAVHMLEAGAEIKLVQELLGHRNIQNTLVYAELVSVYRDEKQKELFDSPFVF